jgi:hypothetical protein
VFIYIRHVVSSIRFACSRNLAKINGALASRSCSVQPRFYLQPKPLALQFRKDLEELFEESMNVVCDFVLVVNAWSADGEACADGLLDPDDRRRCLYHRPKNSGGENWQIIEGRFNSPFVQLH